jgi:cholest-5-ene-3beta,7alpha-diol 3beta-dehydrogenase
MRKKKILLTGASGTIGKQILIKLFCLNKKYELTLLLRPSPKNKRQFKSLEKIVNIIWGDIQNYHDVEKAVFNKDIIIHAAGVLPDIAIFEPDKAKQTNIDGTRNVLDAMKNQKNNPKIIFTSSAVVYSKNLENSIIKVSDKLETNPKDVYTYTKIKAENLIRISGLDYCIFRIPYVVSVDILKFRPIMFHIALDAPIEIIHAKDVAQAIINAMESDRVWDKIFNLGGGSDCQTSYRENLNKFFEIVGLGKNFLPEAAFTKKGIYYGVFDSQETANLQKLLNFQQYTLEDFYNEVKKWIGIKRFLIPLIKPFLRWYILRKSEIYKKNKNESNTKSGVIK